MHWVVLVLLSQDPSEWSKFPPEGSTSQPEVAPEPPPPPVKPGKKGAAAKAPPPEAAPSRPALPSSGIPAAAAQRYRDAVADVTAGRYSDATNRLNELAAAFPQTAEIFAARCSAQLGLRQPTYAEADCNYALQLKPGLSMARYGLAQAEEGNGKRDLALRHYREFQQDPQARADLKAAAGRRADLLSVPAAASAPMPADQDAVAPPPALPQRSTKPECKVGSNGRQACGYNCKVGSDGVSACADMPEGDCVMNADGHVTCAQIAVRGGANAGGAPPECRTGSNGIKVCGYNCKQGTNGRMYCATLPDGVCAQNSDGTFTCP